MTKNEIVEIFGDEDPRWVKCFLAALSGVDAEIAQQRANYAVVELDERRCNRATQEARRRVEEKRALRDLAEQVCEVGAYASREGELLFDVLDVRAGMVELRGRGGAGGPRVPLAAFGDPDNLADDYGLVAAPEARRAETLVRLKIADLLGCRASDVELTWDGASEGVPPEKDSILDVQIRGMRPTKLTWQKLVDAGLPVYSYAAARQSWGEPSTPRGRCPDMPTKDTQ